MLYFLIIVFSILWDVLTLQLTHKRKYCIVLYKQHCVVRVGNASMNFFFVTFTIQRSWIDYSTSKTEIRSIKRTLFSFFLLEMISFIQTNYFIAFLAIFSLVTISNPGAMISAILTLSLGNLQYWRSGSAMKTDHCPYLIKYLPYIIKRKQKF